MEQQLCSSLKNKLLLSFKAFILILKIKLVFCHQTYVASAATYNNRNQTDRFSLIQIKSQILDDPRDVLFNSWNDSVHHCYWKGVTCDTQHDRVIKLDLKGKNLFGSISPHIGNLSFLTSIELQENRLFGSLPPEIGRLFRLKNLNISINTLSGYIPVNITHCSELVNITGRNNRFTGQIPSELGSLRKLMMLSFKGNNLTGYIPTSMGNLSSLNFFSFGSNKLEGYVPKELGKLTNLSVFNIEDNSLTGTFPYFMSNISTISVFSLGINFLHGNLPQDLGFKLPNLEKLYLGKNYFSGMIPYSIVNATKLEILYISSNKLEGQVPMNLGNYLPNLQIISIANNLLGLNSTRDLQFISSLANCTKLKLLTIYGNNFGGVLPKTIGNLSSQLQTLNLGNNKLSGEIPLEIVNLSNLNYLSISSNSFTGTIPETFGKFQSLQGLILSENKLSGIIPFTLFNRTNILDTLILSGNNFEGTIPTIAIGNYSSLRVLYISRNKLTGEIPPITFGKSFSLIAFDISHNLFTGSLPSEVGNLKNLNCVDFSYNSFSGEIPITISECLSLEDLFMQGNSFSGKIPPIISYLKGLQYLDLSKNQLIGEIPSVLGGLMSLEYLNLSFNDLDGEIPTTGIFQNGRTKISLEGNKNLGKMRQYSSHSHTHKKNIGKILALVLVPMFFIVILIYIVFLLHSKKIKRKKKKVLIIPTKEEGYMNISFHELYRATGGFSQENLIGSGSFGLVYKGIIMIDQRQYGRDKQQQLLVVAVKVLDCQKQGTIKSFEAECKVLRNIRHRNLVKILTSCSSIDKKGHDFKALVYEFMENGSLEMWLHHHERSPRNRLNLNQRLNIAIDIVSAIDYLQNDTHDQAPIIHCDLKPSNILLDNNFTAHVSDFGLARLLLSRTSENTSEQGITTNSSTVGIKGTIGYVPPEYGMGHKASIEGDVYSDGILLLELFTGRRPIAETFTEGLNLHNFVKMNFPEQIMDIVDPSLLMFIEDQNYRFDIKKFLISIFNIGLKCSAQMPEDRMIMKEVIKELLHIKESSFGS